MKVAERIGSDWIIDEGLKPGEKVVVEGTQKVKPDMVVNPQPFDPEAAAKAAAAKQRHRPRGLPPNLRRNRPHQRRREEVANHVKILY